MAFVEEEMRLPFSISEITFGRFTRSLHKTNRLYRAYHSSVPKYDYNVTYETIPDYTSDVFDDDDESLYPVSTEDLNYDKIKRNSLHHITSILSQNKDHCTDDSDDLETLTKPKFTANDLNIKNTHIKELLEPYLRERVNNRCSIEIFGSAITGLWTNGSDLDVCIQIPNVTSRSAKIRNLRSIAKVLSPLAPNRTIEQIFNAKIPILHWKHTNCDVRAESDKIGTPPQGFAEPILDAYNAASIDISINNNLAVVNSSLIATYASIDQRVRSLVLFLKMWARNKNLNDRSKGTMGSFAISLMVIHFLQNCTPPVLPSLQDLAFSTNEVPNFVSGVDCRFTTDANKIDAELRYLCNNGPKNALSSRELLMQFFKYFGWFHLHSSKKPICIRSVDFCVFKDLFDDYRKHPSNEPFLHVDNPFEVGIDVANIAIHERSRIISEFRKAYKLLRGGNTASSIL